MNKKSYKVGDIIVPCSASSYIGEIIYVSKEEDTVRHRCIRTKKEYEKSYFGFFCRYMTIEEVVTRNSELIREVDDLQKRFDEATAKLQSVTADLDRTRGELQRLIDERSRNSSETP